ncbi:MAG: MBL fold metallo-hydrolase [Candidatus Zixiibacteriota bacterium]|nr:MAG: MBL fold metallo-hydrolase [candidate division Zixibacteria bacterium]
MKCSILSLILLLALVFNVAGQSAQQEITDPVSISKITENIYIITVLGGPEFGQPLYSTNLVASVGPDGILLIDAGFASTGEQVADTIKTLGNGNLKMIINTHYHADHTPGNRFFTDRAVTVAHASVLDRLNGKFFNLDGTPSPDRPNVGFYDSLSVQFNGEEIRVVHVADCHTDGDAYVYFVGSKIVAAGDLFFADEIPYVELATHGSVSTYTAQIKRFIDEFPDDVTFVPGHGRNYAKDDLRVYYEMLTRTSNIVRQAIADGMTLQQMIDDTILSGWSDWNGQFATNNITAWTRTVYNEESGWGNGKPSICVPLTKALADGSVEDALQCYSRLKSAEADNYDFGEAHLNVLGYQLLMRERVEDALKIFELNVEAPGLPMYMTAMVKPSWPMVTPLSQLSITRSHLN